MNSIGRLIVDACEGWLTGMRYLILTALGKPFEWPTWLEERR